VEEDSVLALADGLLFTLGPVLVLVPVILSWLVVPFGQNLLISNVGVGIFLGLPSAASSPLAC
jgi:NAD(P)H-quinone oxidoreductase subunit 1